MKKRSATFDIMKFFGIMFVIIGHLATTGQRVIFSFHMPLFFIIAGYFYHPKDYKENFKRDAKRLLLPYIFTAAIILLAFRIIDPKASIVKWGIAALCANGSSMHTSLFLADIPPIGAIWFLPALFWCKNIFNILYRQTSHWLIASIVIAIAAIILDCKVINLPLAILPGLSALIFYSIGVVIRERNGFYSLSPFLWTALVVLWIIDFLFSDMSMVRCYYNNFLVNIAGACGGTYVVFLLSNVIATYYNCLKNLFVWIGMNSMTFLCIHNVDLDVPIRYILNIGPDIAVPFAIAECFICTLIFYYIPVTRNIYNISKLSLK